MKNPDLSVISRKVFLFCVSVVYPYGGQHIEILWPALSNQSCSSVNSVAILVMQKKKIGIFVYLLCTCLGNNSKTFPDISKMFVRILF